MPFITITFHGKTVVNSINYQVNAMMPHLYLWTHRIAAGFYQPVYISFKLRLKKRFDFFFRRHWYERLEKMIKKLKAHTFRILNIIEINGMEKPNLIPGSTGSDIKSLLIT